MVKRLVLLIALVAAVGAGGYAAWAARHRESPMAEASRLTAAGDLFKAQAKLRSVIRAEPRNIEAHMALAESVLATADWLSVEREAKTLRGLGVERAIVMPMLVRSYANQERFADILAEVPAVAPRPEEQAMNLALRSVGLLGLGEVAQAEAALDAAAGLAPDDFLVHLQKGRLALIRHDGPEAMREVDKALLLQPTSTEALWVRSEAFRLGWDLPQAIGEMDKAVAVAPMSQDLRMSRAGLLLSAGWDERAHQDVNFVFGLTSKNLAALFYNGMLLMHAGRVLDAGVEFDKLGTAADHFPNAYLYKAQIALKQGNQQSALESALLFLKLEPDDQEGVRLAAKIELDLGRAEQATALLARLRTPDADLLDLRGRALFMEGRMTDAVASFQQATALAPGNKEYASHLTAAQTVFGATQVDQAVLTR